MGSLYIFANKSLIVVYARVFIDWHGPRFIEPADMVGQSGELARQRGGVTAVAEHTDHRRHRRRCRLN